MEAQQSVEEIDRYVFLGPTSLKSRSLRYYRIIHNIVDLMKTLEKQGLFRRYAHQDEHKARIEEEAKHLDEALQRFDVSSASIFTFFSDSLAG